MTLLPTRLPPTSLLLTSILACGEGRPPQVTDAALSGPDAGHPDTVQPPDAAQALEDAANDDGSATVQDGGTLPRDAGSRDDEGGVGLPPDAGSEAGASCAGAPVGDLNCDRCVDEADHQHLLEHYGESVPPGDAASDLNGDGVVDVYDRSLLLANWGEGCQA